MSYVLTVFLDGLKPDSLEYMPFLNSFPYKKRVKTELGYSVACHASMYSGVYPNKHHLWFVWKYSPETSPFKWTKPLGRIPLGNHLAFKYFFHKTSRMFSQNTSYFGIPMVVNLPFQYWSYFDVAEKKLWNEPNYLETYPTVFDFLIKSNIAFEVVGMKQYVGGDSKFVAEHTFTDIKPWTYLFIGDVDHLSHKWIQDSPQAIQKLAALDRLLERKYEAYARQIKDFYFFCFSDHGHLKVTNKIDLYVVFKSAGQNLNEYIHLIDANFARFWFRNDRERKKVCQVIEPLDSGFILSEELLKKYHIDMSDNRYGDLIFYLDTPNVFAKTIWGFSRSIVSMHGYLPDYPESDGVFISNCKLQSGTHIRLVDIAPSILILFNLEIPEYFDGQSIWSV